MSKLCKIFLIFFFSMVVNLGAIENKIILKVNNSIITTLDIFEEMSSLKFFNKKLNQLNDEEIYQISLNTLLKNKIKRNEVIKKTGNIELNDNSYLNSLIQNQYEILGFKNLNDFKKELEDKKVSYKNYEQKLKVDILWNQLIYSIYFNRVTINESELKKQIENQNELITSFELSEIVFQIENNKELEKKYEIIKKDINELGFENAAIKHSISNTSSSGGYIGWINENQINKQIQKNLNEISKDSITMPVRISGGFLILKKNNFKKIKKELNLENELKKLVNFETENQLNNYSNLHFNKIKKNVKIYVP